MAQPPELVQPTSDQHALLAQTLGVIAAIAGLTAVRVLLLLAVAGDFYLATVAASGPISALYVLVSYSVLTVLPLVWLDSSKRGAA